MTWLWIKEVIIWIEGRVCICSAWLPAEYKLGLPQSLTKRSIRDYVKGAGARQGSTWQIMLAGEGGIHSVWGRRLDRGIAYKNMVEEQLWKITWAWPPASDLQIGKGQGWGKLEELDFSRW